ncbi:major facilitator superfamily domain-containing protein [Phlebopus sp. FC_14]|nr:major facilitator superfamily domain-containing protein [Phlebopus sp. FC_14]
MDDIELTPRTCSEPESPQAQSDVSPSKDMARGSSGRTPLPKLQLLVLLYIQLAEPITCTVIYPFVNQLVRESGVTSGDERKTGYYAGLIESIFYATEAATVLQWGRASDVVGRKPIILIGLFGLALSVLSFGVSRQYWTLVLSRCAEGVLNGNVGVVKSVMAEITDESNMAQGFAFLPMIWSTGSIIGPLLGGILAHPEVKWPHSIGRLAFFHKYPYFLPCLSAASFSMTAFILTLLFLREGSSRSLARGWLRWCSAKEGPLPDDNGKDVPHFTEEPQVIGAQKASTSTPIQSLFTRSVVIPIINYGFLAFVDQSVMVLQPLMYSTSITLGGLSFSTNTIGIILAAWGIVNGIVQIFAFPPLLRRLGPRKLYVSSFACYSVALATFPLMNYLAKKSGHVDAKVWTVLVAQLIAYLAAYNAYGCVFVCVNNGAPSKEALGATNGLAQTTASMMRAIAPSVSSSLFSLSLERNLAGGTAVYWILCALVIGGVFAATHLPSRLSTQSGVEDPRGLGGNPPK